MILQPDTDRLEEPPRDRLLGLILDEIRSSGPMTVARFVERCLYHPECGYYMNPRRKTGREGDYFTSPMLNPFFAQAVGRYIGRCLERINAAPLMVVEVGAGDGRLLAQAARALAKQGGPCLQFVAIEAGGGNLPAIVEAFGCMGLPEPRVLRTMGELPSGFSGVVFSNELVDAMPVHVLVKRKAWIEIYVGEREGRLVEVEGEVSSTAALAHAQRYYSGEEPGLRIEVNLEALRWMEAAAKRLEAGAVITIDYGGTTREIANRAGHAGTLRAFYRHRAGESILSRPGSQDLTHTVDFAPLIDSGRELGFTNLPLTAQAAFLIAQGALDELEQGSGRDPVEAIRHRLSLKRLLCPGGMGDSFRVLVQGKGIGLPPIAV